MSYIDDSLRADEQVVYSTSLHWMIFWRPAVLFAIAMVGIVIVSGGWMVLSNLFVPLAGLDALSLFMLYLSSEVRVTDQRVLGKAGWLPHRSLEAPLSEIEGFGVRQGILGRMFGYGTIVVSSASGPRRRLAHIRRSSSSAACGNRWPREEGEILQTILGQSKRPRSRPTKNEVYRDRWAGCYAEHGQSHNHPKRPAGGFPFDTRVQNLGAELLELRKDRMPVKFLVFHCPYTWEMNAR